MNESLDLTLVTQEVNNATPCAELLVVELGIATFSARHEREALGCKVEERGNESAGRSELPSLTLRGTALLAGLGARCVFGLDFNHVAKIPSEI